MNTAIADKHTLITASEWFGGGHRVPYDPNRRRILTATDDTGRALARRKPPSL